MPERSLIFPRHAFEARIAALQAEMAQRNEAALLLTAPADIFYTTGFLTRFWESPARPWFLIIPAQGSPIAVIPAIGADLMGRTWVDDIRTWDAPDPVDDGVTLLTEALAEIVPDGGHIAVPMRLETSLRMPLGDFGRLREALNGRGFVDGTATTQRVREIKSEAEIEKIHAVCQIADAAFTKVPEIVSAAPQIDTVFRRFQAALLTAGADWVSYTAGGAGPGGYGDVISPAEARDLRDGDVLMLDTGAVKDGYFCDYDRNFAIGHVADDTARAQDALYEATEKVLAEIRPGQLASDIHTRFVTSLEAQGQKAGGGRLGHGLGTTLTEWPSFTSKDKTPLRAGMVLTLEPSVEIAPGRMLVHEENIVLRADGAELLSPRAPRALPVIAL